MGVYYIRPTNGPFFKVENPIFESKRARKIWLPLLLILGAVTVGGMFIGEGVKGAVVQLLLEGVLNQRHALLHLGVVGVLRRVENDFLGLGHVPGPVVQSVGHPQDEKKRHH